jgi:hypothetical protein
MSHLSNSQNKFKIKIKNKMKKKLVSSDNDTNVVRFTNGIRRKT